MYAGRGETLPLPNEGHLHILRSGYVYWEDDGRWDKDCKCRKDTRRSIGKLDPSNKKRFYPNNTYYEIFGGGEVPGIFSKVLTFGPYEALYATGVKIGLIETLQSVFVWEWDQIFALAMHALCAESATAQAFPAWCFHNYCGLSKPLSSGEISRLYEKIADDPDRIARFMREFRKTYGTRIGGKTEVCLAFDSTSQSSTSGNNYLTAHGHPKQNKGIPQINTGLFADERTGIPLFYEHFIGSILDKTQTPYTVEKAVDLGFEKLFLVVDRGYFSKKALDALSEQEFSMNIPSDASVVDSMLSKYRTKILNNVQYYLSDEKVYGIHVPDTPALGGTYDAYLFYDDARAYEERASIYAKLKFMEDKIMQRKRYTEKLGRMYARWITVEKTSQKDDDGRNFSVRINATNVQTAISDAGYFVVLSNAGLSAADMIRIVRMRDRDEKLFQRLKSHFELTSPYTHSAQTYEGKMFVIFIALILAESYRWFVREILKSTTSETLATSLGELSKYQIQQKQNGSWMPSYAATRKQKELLAKLDVSDTDLDKAARAVHLGKTTI